MFVLLAPGVRAPQSHMGMASAFLRRKHVGEEQPIAAAAAAAVQDVDAPAAQQADEPATQEVDAPAVQQVDAPTPLGEVRCLPFSSASCRFSSNLHAAEIKAHSSHVPSSGVHGCRQRRQRCEAWWTLQDFKVHKSRLEREVEAAAGRERTPPKPARVPSYMRPTANSATRVRPPLPCVTCPPLLRLSCACPAGRSRWTPTHRQAHACSPTATQLRLA